MSFQFVASCLVGVFWRGRLSLSSDLYGILFIFSISGMEPGASDILDKCSSKSGLAVQP